MASISGGVGASHGLLTSVLDTHNDFRSLEDAEAALHEMVAGDARRGFTLTTHQDWLRRCHAKGTRPEFCDSEDTLERWEQIVADIKWRAIQEWKLATTVQMFFTDGYVEPETSVSLVLAPNPANLKL